MELWTQAHAQTLIPATVVMILVGILLRFWMKDKSLKLRMIPIQVIAVILVLLEIGKQAVSFSRGYDLYHIPLHFCSLLIFAMPVMAFYRGKHRDIISGVFAALCTSVTLLTLIYPNLIYSAGNIEGYFADFLDFHTVTFHNLVVLSFVLLFALEVHVPVKGEQKAAVIFVAVVSVIQGVAANTLRTNFANFYSCNIPPLEQVRLTVQASIGYGLAQVFYGCIVAVLQVLFVMLAYWVYRLLRQATKSRTKTRL